MGMPSLSIYVNELIKDYDAKTLIRIGSAGGMSPKVKLRDVVIAMTASTLSTPSLGMFKEINFAPCADYGLLGGGCNRRTRAQHRRPCGRNLFVRCLL
jgi:purine-nucleoside phosphorylase